MRCDTVLLRSVLCLYQETVNKCHVVIYKIFSLKSFSHFCLMISVYKWIPTALYSSVYPLDSMPKPGTLLKGHKFRRGREWTVKKKGTSVSHCQYLIGIGIKHFVTVQAQRSRNWLWMQLCLRARAGSSSSFGSELTTRSRGSIHTMNRASSVLMLISQLLELASLGIFKHPLNL